MKPHFRNLKSKAIVLMVTTLVLREFKLLSTRKKISNLQPQKKSKLKQAVQLQKSTLKLHSLHLVSSTFCNIESPASKEMESEASSPTAEINVKISLPSLGQLYVLQY